MSIEEFGVFTVILTLADFRNATWLGSGTEIAKILHIRKQFALEHLRSLRSKGYLQFDDFKGAHKKYAIFIPKYYTAEDGSSVPEMTRWEPRKLKRVQNGNRGSYEDGKTGTEEIDHPVKDQQFKPSQEVSTKNRIKEEKK